MTFGWLERKLTEMDLPVVLLYLRRQPRGWTRYGAVILSTIISFLLALWMLQSIISDSLYGRDLFLNVLFAIVINISMAILILAGPNQSGMVISSEIERMTFEPLALTALKSSEIIDQKMAASMLEFALIFAPSILIALMSWLAGKVFLMQVAGAYIILFIAIITLGYLGVMMSCYIKKSASAGALAFFVALIGTVFIPALDLKGLLLSMHRTDIAASLVISIATLLITGRILARRSRTNRKLTTRVRNAFVWIAIWFILHMSLLRIPDVMIATYKLGAGFLPMVLECMSPFHAFGHLGLYGERVTDFFGYPGYFGTLGTIVLWTGIAFYLRKKAIRRLEFLRRGGYTK